MAWVDLRFQVSDLKIQVLEGESARAEEETVSEQ